MNEANFTPPHLSKPEERLGLLLWFRLSRIYNHNIRENNQHLKAWNLSTAQFDVLVQVGTEERMSQQELANKLLVTKGNITQLLSKMEDLGLIQRETDWKTKYVSLTDQGRALYDEVVPAQEQFQASQFSKLSKDERKELLKLLKKLQD
ncbi:MarR family winged helix-turn-helix transcriptional regulator [Paenibacillus shunpengii]|uniref:MarR family transcriptional regulator n=2 Tax=Paenibacillus TaxID=44249 RepID=A0AAX3N1H3_9BACL|nr:MULTISPECIES: MarR family transcriptional regulator [Paenibacillus]OMC72022.1 MarR family transcriptional regulator [Paenibacillus sp. FSL H7-0326]WDH83710.1 MarR family transcriptional regulator [Paenibacillus urinalis]SDX33265.1 DNA-binding transcriptional regulator, MarR family [Paenibacillus sp. PDC88]